MVLKTLPSFSTEHQLEKIRISNTFKEYTPSQDSRVSHIFSIEVPRVRRPPIPRPPAKHLSRTLGWVH